MYILPFAIMFPLELNHRKIELKKLQKKRPDKNGNQKITTFALVW
jgi:hypothetical protein